jgi:hypothetical protein
MIVLNAIREPLVQGKAQTSWLVNYWVSGRSPTVFGMFNMLRPNTRRADRDRLSVKKGHLSAGALAKIFDSRFISSGSRKEACQAL